MSVCRSAQATYPNWQPYLQGLSIGESESRETSSTVQCIYEAKSLRHRLQRRPRCGQEDLDHQGQQPEWEARSRGVRAVDQGARSGERPAGGYGSAGEFDSGPRGRKLVRTRLSFGLPAPYVAEARWEDFVRNFASRYKTFRRFARGCHKPELKRLTDLSERTPFSALNLRLRYQTYYGIRHVLAPLLDDPRVIVKPMQRNVSRLEPHSLVVLEVCPASTLKRLRLKVPPYKRAGEQPWKARASVLHRLRRLELVQLDRSTFKAVEADTEGDALDSVLAAMAVCRAMRPEAPSPGAEFAIEGFVYS